MARRPGSDRRRDSRDSAWQAPARAGSAFRVKLVTVTVAVVTALVAAGGSLAGRRGARARRRRTRRRRPSSCATDDDCSGASLSSLMIYLGCGTPGGPGAAHAVPGPTTTTGPASRTHWARHRRRPSTVTADSDRSEHDDRRWPPHYESSDSDETWPPTAGDDSESEFVTGSESSDSESWACQ